MHWSKLYVDQTVNNFFAFTQNAFNDHILRNPWPFFSFILHHLQNYIVAAHVFKCKHIVSKTVKNTFKTEWWQMYCISAVTRLKHIEHFSRIFNHSKHSWLQFQLKAYPSVLFLVSLPNKQKRMASEWFSLETWIKENRLVGKEEWQGEGECVEDKGEEDQERWSLMR